MSEQFYTDISRVLGFLHHTRGVWMSGRQIAEGTGVAVETAIRIAARYAELEKIEYRPIKGWRAPPILEGAHG